MQHLELSMYVANTGSYVIFYLGVITCFKKRWNKDTSTHTFVESETKKEREIVDGEKFITMTAEKELCENGC